MNVIDAHHHFWKYNADKHSWISDEMSVLKNDFLAQELLTQFEANGVKGSVAVQADQSSEETDFLLELAANNDFIKGVVGWLDLRSENMEEECKRYASQDKLKGLRHVVQDEPDDNFMLLSEFQRGIATLSKFDWTYDILIFPKQLPTAIQLVNNFPDQPFVIDHIAKPSIKTGGIKTWAADMKKIAAHENVYCKVSGMITEADWANWTYEDVLPYLDVVFQAFGPERIMYGSDYPVCLLAGGYGAVKGIVERYLEGYSEEDQQKVWFRNAIDFYQL